MNRSKTKPVLLSVVAMGLLVVGIGAGVQFFGPTREHKILGSYFFDVTDRNHLAGFADVIVIASVEQVESMDRDDQTTRFRVRPTDWLKGETSPAISVDQMGFELGRDVFVPEDQSVLEPGGTYLIVLRESREEPGTYGVVGGPASVTRVDAQATGELRAGTPSAASPTEIERVWSEAVRDQEYPPSAPRD